MNTKTNTNQQIVNVEFVDMYIDQHDRIMSKLAAEFPQLRNFPSNSAKFVFKVVDFNGLPVGVVVNQNGKLSTSPDNRLYYRFDHTGDVMLIIPRSDGLGEFQTNYIDHYDRPSLTSQMEIYNFAIENGRDGQAEVDAFIRADFWNWFDAQCARWFPELNTSK